MPTVGSAKSRQQIGNATDCALLGWLADLGVDYESVRAGHPEDELVKVYSLNSTRKYMATVVRLDVVAAAAGTAAGSDADNSRLPDSAFRVYVKGAADVILHRSVTSLLYISQ